MKSVYAMQCVVLACLGAFPALGSSAFQKAQWIWEAAASANLAATPAGSLFFRGELFIPASVGIRSAEVVVTADNAYALHLNGKPVGESSVDHEAWHRAGRYDIASLVQPGRNLLALRVVNTISGPAGLLLQAEVQLSDGRRITFSSDGNWRCHKQEDSGWKELAFEDGSWPLVRSLGRYGEGPWGKQLSIPAEATPAGALTGQVARRARELQRQQTRQPQSPSRVVDLAPGPDFSWPEGILFLGDDCSLYRPKGPQRGGAADSLNVTIFNSRNTCATPEHDLPAPMRLGRKLMALVPAKPGVQPRVLFDAGEGAIGSPCVTFDGTAILFSMARKGEAFFHLYRLPVRGGEVEQLTDGPFHDIDPAEMPDGRIVFTSTRLGTFEEYHSPPTRSLFVMDAEGKGIRPLTYTPIFDNEPSIMADGRILFVRADNFFDRGKVENTLHSVHQDGCAGQTEFGLENVPEYGNRLRAYSCGSPAPLDDGRVAFVSAQGITLGRPGAPASRQRQLHVLAGDVASLPDNRLLCSRGGMIPLDLGEGKQVQDIRFREIGIVDPARSPATFTTLYQAETETLHSPQFLGARKRPPVMFERVDPERDELLDASGTLFCSDVYFSGNTTAGWPHVRAVRIMAAKPLTLRSSHSYIVHAGTEVVELGTVPLAEDGSFHVEVPANTPLAMQLVDAEGRSELNEMSWIYVRPGEQRACTGCHQPRREAPKTASGGRMTLTRPPVKLTELAGRHRYRGNNPAVTGLMELQFDRFREVAGLNRHPAGVTSRSGREDRAALLARLESGDAEQKISAAQRLGILRDSLAEPALRETLSHPVREVAMAAATALAACGTRESVPALLKTMEQREGVVAQAAAMAVENLTGYSATFSAYAPAEQRRAQASEWRAWFERTGWEQIEADLVSRLSSQNRDEVRRAAVALGHTGGDPAREGLRAYLRAHRGDNPYPAWRKAGHRGDAARFNAQSPVNPRTLQAVTRSIGYLRDQAAIPLLEETALQAHDPETGNLFLAEAAIEALGRMESADADASLLNILKALHPYERYTRWYGDHPALMACHASPLHFFILQALDTRELSGHPEIIPLLLRSIPTDPDRALFFETDDFEELVGRVIRRNGGEHSVVETCLSVLGDPAARPTPDIRAALSGTPSCWAGTPGPEIRAAQVLSMVCRDPAAEPRIRAAHQRYQQVDDGIARVFEKGIPVVQKMPRKHWVCFYLARNLAYLGEAASVEFLITSLKHSPAEAAAGRPDPLGPGVLFLHNDLTPCWRAAVAWALGRLGDARAVPVLLEIIADLENATDTRHAAAEALGLIAHPGHREAIQTLAAEYPEVSVRRSLMRVAANRSPGLTALD